MIRDRKDRAGNWIIDSHGISLLRLANVRRFTERITRRKLACRISS
jgi:hypothetical protein